ncbi:MAG: YdeI family protein [Planctomycetota bacterium]
MKKHATVDEFMEAAKEWKAELRKLRSILQATELEETVKWGGPVYTIEGKNVVGVGGFKSYFGLWFFQGALLADEHKLLVNAQEGRTKAQRQLRWQSMADIDRKLVTSYVKEAIALAKQGVAIPPARNQPLVVPAEIKAALRKHPKAKKMFEGMTLGKRREYVEYIATAQREDTKQRRIAKILPMLEAGAGLNDKYR